MKGGALLDFLLRPIGSLKLLVEIFIFLGPNCFKICRRDMLRRRNFKGPSVMCILRRKESVWLISSFILDGCLRLGICLSLVGFTSVAIENQNGFGGLENEDEQELSLKSLEDDS